MQPICNLCGQGIYTILESKGIFKLVKCNYCGLIYVTPFPLKEFIEEYYNFDYYINLAHQLQKTAKIWQKRLKTIEGFHKKGRLLDVGCGTGDFLFFGMNNGWKVYGTEIRNEVCNYIKEKRGIEIYNGKLKDANYPEDFFDVITLWHVLEHMEDPLENLKEVNRILKKDGLLVVAIPNVNSYIYKILYLISKIKNKPFFLFGKKGQELHLYHFSPVTIKEILKKAGFDVFLIRPDIAQITLLKHIIDKITENIFSPLKLKIALSMQIYARKIKF